MARQRSEGGLWDSNDSVDRTPPDFVLRTFPTEVEVVWALAHASLMITLPRGLKPTLQGLLSDTSLHESAPVQTFREDREGLDTIVRSIPQGFQGVKHRGNRMESTNKQTPSPLFVPSGTPDNSPPFQRWGTPSCLAPAPSGASEIAAHAPGDTRRPRGSVVPDGTDWFDGRAVPPLKRWAIVGCP